MTGSLGLMTENRGEIRGHVTGSLDDQGRDSERNPQKKRGSQPKKNW